MNLSSVFRTTLLLLPVTLGAQTAYDSALIGDMPYGGALEAKYERVIVDINQQNISFTAHIGDTKSGSTRCDDMAARATM